MSTSCAATLCPSYFLIRIIYVMQKCGTTASNKTSSIKSILNSSKSDHIIIITAFNRSIFVVAAIMLSPAIMLAVKERCLCPSTRQFVQPNYFSALAEARLFVADRGPTETYVAIISFIMPSHSIPLILIERKCCF